MQTKQDNAAQAAWTSSTLPHQPNHMKLFPALSFSLALPKAVPKLTLPKLDPKPTE